MDEYSTHLPVLKKVLEVFKPKKILEHGCGDFSTPLLASAGELMFTEHDITWINKVLDNPQLGDVNFTMTDTLVGQSTDGVDLAFIDGKREGRAPSIQYCLNEGVPVIVYHDSHIGHHYKYDSIVLPAGYRQADFVYTGPSGRGTTVLWQGEEKVSEWIIDSHQVRNPYYFPTIGWGI